MSEEKDWTERDKGWYTEGRIPMYYKDAVDLSEDADQAKEEFRDNLDKEMCPNPVTCPFTDDISPHPIDDHNKDPRETRHPSSQRFHQILRSLGDLHDQKQRDYGTSTDPFANVRASESFGIPGWLGAIIRGNDKMRRVMTASNQVLSGEEVSMANESFEDALRDLAVYAIIALVLFEEDELPGVEATPADLIAAVRRESGTIKGEVVMGCTAHDMHDHDNCEIRQYLRIPVSDGGSET